MEVIKFTLPSLPSSMNRIYGINYRLRSMYLIPDVLLWKTSMKQIVPKFKDKDINNVKIDVVFYYNFYYKNGKIKKIDTQNLLKVLIDCISEKIQIDDSRFKFGSWSSYHSEEPKVEVTLNGDKIE